MRKIRRVLGVLSCCLLLSMMPLSAEAGSIRVNFDMQSGMSYGFFNLTGYMQFENNIDFGVWNDITSLTDLEYEFTGVWMYSNQALVGHINSNNNDTWSTWYGNLMIEESRPSVFVANFDSKTIFFGMSDSNAYMDLILFQNGSYMERNKVNDLGNYTTTVWFDDPVSAPIPGAVWLLGSGVIGLAGVRRKLKK